MFIVYLVNFKYTWDSRHARSLSLFVKILQYKTDVLFLHESYTISVSDQ